jgi:hypothetical protein
MRFGKSGNSSRNFPPNLEVIGSDLRKKSSLNLRYGCVPTANGGRDQSVENDDKLGAFLQIIQNLRG